jgi:integrase
MPGKRAKILSAPDVDDLLVFASCTRQPLRNTVMVLLSAKAGLRAGEIANLTWDMVVNANGQISGLIELADTAAKKCSGRSIPIHPGLVAALAAWRQVAPPSDYVITSERRGRMRPLSIVVWFNRAFKNIGLRGCSSRRTFVTRAARIVHKAGGSLRDVQVLAGHRSIQTTQRYIDGDTDAQRKLVSMI